MTLVAEVVRISMNVAEFFIAVGGTYVVGFLHRHLSPAVTPTTQASIDPLRGRSKKWSQIWSDG